MRRRRRSVGASVRCAGWRLWHATRLSFGTLQHLDLNHCKIGDLRELTTLGASTRELGDDGSAALAAAQRGHRALYTIRVCRGERTRHPFSCHVD
jgi:hypothetical protein